MPVDETQGISTDASSLIVGDFSKPFLGIRQEFMIEVIKTSTYAQKLELTVLAHARIDWQASHPAAFARLIGITT